MNRPMPERPHELHARCAGDLRVPPIDEWDSWPFEGDVRPKALRPPGEERVRAGEGGADCPACTKPDSDYVWTDERWRLLALGPSGLPMILILEPREHYDTVSDLPGELARASPRSGTASCRPRRRTSGTRTSPWSSPPSTEQRRRSASSGRTRPRCTASSVLRRRTPSRS
jgi:hypothetical protein